MSELPVEHELIDGELYVNENGSRGTWKALTKSFVTGGFNSYFTVQGKLWQRLGPVAEYRPAPAEPQGLGAVIEGSGTERWVRVNTFKTGAPWYCVRGPGIGAVWRWASIPQPVTVLSEGVEL